MRYVYEGDIALLKTYGIGPYTNQIKQIEEDISKLQDTVKELIGIKERYDEMICFQFFFFIFIVSFYEYHQKPFYCQSIFSIIVMMYSCYSLVSFPSMNLNFRNDNSDTGLSQPSQWDLVSDKQMIAEEAPLQVARCTQIMNAGQEDQNLGRQLLA